MKAIFSTLLFFFAAGTALAQSTATYSLRFESTWSQATHPTDWPGSSAHFSGVFGGTHNSSGSYWAPGTLASSGVVNVAELGSGIAFRNEVANSPHSDKGMGLSGIALSPDVISHSFIVDENFSLVTLISMLAPSPDWFVGVSGLDLHDGTNWIPQIVVPLVAWDSGTDNGTSYFAANSPNTPVNVERLGNINDGNPLNTDDIVGSFTFILENPLAVEIKNFSHNYSDNLLELKWETANETNNLGFEVQHSSDSIEWYPMGFVDGDGTSLESRNYSFLIDGPLPGFQSFRLLQIDFDGSVSFSEVLHIDIPSDSPLKVSNPYPNPAINSSSLSISSANANFLKIELFDSSGRKIRNLFEGALSPRERMNININTEALPRGVYFVSASGNENSLLTKLIKQ